MGKDIIDSLISDWKLERPELNAQSMHIVGRLLKLGKTLEKTAGSALSSCGIYYTDLDVLATLRRSGHPYELPPKVLMGSVLITSGAMSALLDRLARLELIYRAPDQDDGRIKKAGLTDKGIEIIDRAIEIRFKEADEAIKSLSQDEQKQLIPILRKLMCSLG